MFVSALKSLQNDGARSLIGRQVMATREAIDRLLVSDTAPRRERRLSQQKKGVLPTLETGQVGSFRNRSSFEPCSFENALPDMTIPYRPLEGTVYATRAPRSEQSAETICSYSEMSISFLHVLPIFQRALHCFNGHRHVLEMLGLWRKSTKPVISGER